MAVNGRGCFTVGPNSSEEIESDSESEVKSMKSEKSPSSSDKKEEEEEEEENNAADDDDGCGSD